MKLAWHVHTWAQQPFSRRYHVFNASASRDLKLAIIPLKHTSTSRKGACRKRVPRFTTCPATCSRLPAAHNKNSGNIDPHWAGLTFSPSSTSSSSDTVLKVWTSSTLFRSDMVSTCCPSSTSSSSDIVVKASKCVSCESCPI